MHESLSYPMQNDSHNYDEGDIYDHSMNLKIIPEIEPTPSRLQLNPHINTTFLAEQFNNYSMPQLGNYTQEDGTTAFFENRKTSQTIDHSNRFENP